ncbi:MAG: hypothetical protein R3C56_19640 [Pirellulaceae bacterium]
MQLAGAAAETPAVATSYVGFSKTIVYGNGSTPCKSRMTKNSLTQTTMIMRDRPQYRETYLLKRGQYDQPDESQALWPAVPAVLPPLSREQPPNRLGLAAWMVDDRNPLVARVAVNRAAKVL